MKKLFMAVVCAVLVITMLVSLSACGGEGKSEGKSEDFYGTWKIDYIDYDGSEFTVDEWNNMEDEDFSGFYIILKEGGKAYIYDGDYGDLVDWLKSDNSIMIGDAKCSVDGNKICLDYYDVKLYLKKSSDNQEIPKEDDESDDVDEDLNFEDDSTADETTSSDTANDTSEDAEWKEFLEDYEVWVDDYIEIVKKYKDNPTDMSILSDYTEMVSEMADWSERADEIELELEDTSAALEYSAELLRIAGKLAEVAY